MLTLEEIRYLLQDRRISVIAAATGVHVNTVRMIRDNPDHDPRYRVTKALSDYFSKETA